MLAAPRRALRHVPTLAAQLACLYPTPVAPRRAAVWLSIIG